MLHSMPCLREPCVDTCISCSRAQMHPETAALQSAATLVPQTQEAGG